MRRPYDTGKKNCPCHPDDGLFGKHHDYHHRRQMLREDAQYDVLW